LVHLIALTAPFPATGATTSTGFAAPRAAPAPAATRAAALAPAQATTGAEPPLMSYSITEVPATNPPSNAPESILGLACNEINNRMNEEQTDNNINSCMNEQQTDRS
jgi:hypothetical protein